MLISLSIGDYGTLSLLEIERMGLLLDSLGKYFQTQYNTIRKHKDDAYADLVNTMRGQDAVFNLKQRYHNNKLAALVLNKGGFKKIVYQQGEYIPKNEPVLRDGHSNWGRAHFFAPNKNFAGIKISTPLFNVLVIWSMTLLLYVTLYLDVLSSIIHYFEKFQLRRRFKLNLSKV